MKYFLILFIIPFYNVFTTAQNDQFRDYLWLFGYDSNPTDLNFGGTNIDFSTSPPDIYYEFRPMDFGQTNASICDKGGNLLFYTNGIYVASKNGQQMENGDDLSPGGFNDAWNDVGLNMAQGALILPMPGNDSLYVLIHATYDIFGVPATGGGITTLYYSMIDIFKNNGEGAVVEKNKTILQDSLIYGEITAARHGNGRDWWLLMSEYDTNNFYKWLLTLEGIKDQGQQSIGNIVNSGLGQAVYSPDGFKYVTMNLIGIIPTSSGNQLTVYDFDRCTGLLSDPVQLFYPDSNVISGGVAISPNSRFLYISQHHTVFQFDLTASDLAASRIPVAIYDGTQSPFPTTFYLAQLAPDGKIYINSPNGVDKLHVIHNPDLKGDSCNFEQNGIDLPTFNAFTMPNFPNFRLGKWEGSPCDTIQAVGTTGAFSFSKIFVYPNPASEYVVFDNSHTTEKITRVLFYNNMGEIVFGEKWDGNLREYKMDVSGLAAGIYFYTIFGKERILKSGKIIIQHD